MLPKRIPVVVVLVAGMAASTVAITEVDAAEKAAAARKRIEKALAGLTKGEGSWKDFSVTYSDLHGFHGGLKLTIDGSGKVTQTAVRVKAGKEKAVSKASLRDLVQLLQKQKAWVQKEPERAAVPDESRAVLSIKYGKDAVRIWEWFNDLSKNKRIAEIRDAMKKMAWESIPKK